jgi:sporulation protein YlmC with PRC-barrel domain
LAPFGSGFHGPAGVGHASFDNERLLGALVTLSGMNAAPEEITSLVGREVYSSNGVFVGEIEDIQLDLDARSVTGLALAELNHELFAGQVDGSTGVVVPYRWVRAVGDVVLINDVIERYDTGDSEDEEPAEVEARSEPR